MKYRNIKEIPVGTYQNCISAIKFEIKMAAQERDLYGRCAASSIYGIDKEYEEEKMEILADKVAGLETMLAFLEKNRSSK